MFDLIQLQQAIHLSKKEAASVMELRHRLDHNANALGYQVQTEIEGDGNCMFAALTNQLERIGEN
jgi:hypothetical protein